MNKEIKRALYLENVYSINLNTVEASGRHIKAQRQLYSLITNPTERLKYEYNLTRSLQKHIMLLQENIINSNGKTPNKKVGIEFAKRIKDLTTSPIALHEGNYSYVDVESLRNQKVLDKTVLLKKDIVLPIKVKSSDNLYKFNTQIILSTDNVLSYASYTFSKDEYTKVPQTTKIVRMGKGIKHNEIIENANKDKSKAR